MESGTIRHASAEPADRRFQLGTNQSGMRDQNERLVLSLVRQNGSLAKTDIARMTRLSAQTISVIMRELEEEGLLLRQEPMRGKVGQPSIPMALNPDGAYFIGLKIGRRSAELVLIDFLGKVRAMLQNSYRYPAPREILDFVNSGIKRLRAGLDAGQDKRIAGLGIAMPFELWNWADASGSPAGAMDEWRDADIRREIASRCTFPVYLQNDATSACGAELVFGKTRALRDFLYFYVGAFVGGGIVLNRSLYSGASGNAGALGSMPVPGPNGTTRQLIDVASIAVLETALVANGMDSTPLWTEPETWWDIGAPLDHWIDDAASGLAHATLAASAVVDFEAAIIDGWMPLDVRRRLVDTTRDRIATLDSEGLTVPSILEGTVGLHARALGGASLPLSDRFLIGPASAAKTI